ncbi:hypothetical protein FGG08_001229 [Glutinoglossum americanum]|uniref:Uncharacterized protein n=1 Tax=Glutinoglossum americanum TaxID=1670608 RepID=A0A9P8IBK1_9PEZI|nr:hypothetical protein FGG08_001229 [Glutinoglossum americanum]
MPPKTPERAYGNLAEGIAILITSDDDVQFVSQTAHGRPRKRRRKAPAMPDQTPETPAKKTQTASSPNTSISNSSPRINRAIVTSTDRRYGSELVTKPTPAILVTRSPSPQPPVDAHPAVAPTPHPPRPPPLYSIPAYVPPSPQSLQRKGRQPWNSKLFASLAQTLQNAMPFEEFAAKHGRPVGEVLDVFSACVQLPLLKKSAEGLARAREAREAVKNFQDMRKDVKGILQRGQDDGTRSAGGEGEVVIVETQLKK